MACNVPSEGGKFGGRAERTLRETLLHSGLELGPQSSALTSATKQPLHSGLYEIGISSSTDFKKDSGAVSQEAAQAYCPSPDRAVLSLVWVSW